MDPQRKRRRDSYLGLLLIVLSFILFFTAAPVANGRIYPKWLPVLPIQICLMAISFVLFLAGLWIVIESCARHGDKETKSQDP